MPLSLNGRHPVSVTVIPRSFPLPLPLGALQASFASEAGPLRILSPQKWSKPAVLKSLNSNSRFSPELVRKASFQTPAQSLSQKLSNGSARSPETIRGNSRDLGKHLQEWRVALSPECWVEEDSREGKAGGGWGMPIISALWRLRWERGQKSYLVSSRPA